MIQHYILVDGKPQPADIETALIWLESESNRVIAIDYLAGSTRVSTVFLGFDHSTSLNPSRPILFESMVFNGGNETYRERYSTIEEARAGHVRIVGYVAAGLHPRRGEPWTQN